MPNDPKKTPPKRQYFPSAKKALSPEQKAKVAAMRTDVVTGKIEPIAGNHTLTLGQKRYVEEKLKGKGIRQAARDAGYSPSTVAVAGRDLDRKPAVQAEFQRLFNQAVSDEELVERIREGLSATDKKYYTFKGKVEDEREDPHWTERRLYLEMAARVKQVIPKDQEDSRELPPIQVNIVHIGGGRITD